MVQYEGNLVSPAAPLDPKGAPGARLPSRKGNAEKAKPPHRFREGRLNCALARLATSLDRRNVPTPSSRLGSPETAAEP